MSLKFMFDFWIHVLVPVLLAINAISSSIVDTQLFIIHTKAFRSGGIGYVVVVVVVVHKKSLRVNKTWLNRDIVYDAFLLILFPYFEGLEMSPTHSNYL